MKKSLFVIFIILSMLLASCGGDAAPDEPKGSASGSVDESGHVTLDFWFALGGDSGKAVEELVRQFNESQDAITVNATYQGNYGAAMAKMWGAISAGTTPNVAQLGGAPLLEETGAIVAVEDYLDEEGFDRSAINQAFWDYNTARGKIWTMPFNNSVPLLYYNKDLFTKAGLDPNTPPTTWDELIEFGKKLTVDTDNNGEIDQWGFNTPDDTHWYLTMLFLGNGVRIINDDGSEVLYDSPEAVEVMTTWSNMVSVDKIMPPNQHSEAKGDFLAGKLGMLIASSSGTSSTVRDAPFEVGIAVVPGIGGNDPVLPVGGASLTIMKHENEVIQDAAWEFVKFMTSRESSLYLSTHTGYLPIYHDVAESAEFLAYIEENPHVQASIDSLPYAYSIVGFSALGTSDTELRKAVEIIELGQGTPQEVLTNAKAAVQKFIEEQAQDRP